MCHFQGHGKLMIIIMMVSMSVSKKSPHIFCHEDLFIPQTIQAYILVHRDELVKFVLQIFRQMRSGEELCRFEIVVFPMSTLQVAVPSSSHRNDIIQTRLSSISDAIFLVSLDSGQTDGYSMRFDSGSRLRLFETEFLSKARRWHAGSEFKRHV